MAITAPMQQTGGTAADLTAINPIPLDRQIVVERDTGRFKIGDGVRTWAALPYASQPAGDYATNAALTAAVATAVNGLINGSPAALDTLKELADALGDDANFAATISAQIAAKYTKPSSGIPTTDLAAAIQTALTAAGTAVQPPALTSAVTTAEARVNHTGTQPASTITGLATVATSGLASDVGLGNVNNTSDAAKPISTATQAALAAKADLVGGVVPTSQIPAVALTNVVSVASQSAMLALSTNQVQPGDVASRTDGAGTFMLSAADPSQLSSWVLLNAPTDKVVSVNSQVGTVVLAKADVGLGNVDNTSDVNKPVSTAAANAIAGVQTQVTSNSATIVTNSSSIATNAARVLSGPAAALTAAGTLTPGVPNTVDGTAAPFTATLPTPTVVGQLVPVERIDVSTTNAVMVTGTIRGLTTTITLPAMGVAGEGLLFEAESLTSWRPIAGHKPASWLDARYDPRGAAAGLALVFGA